MLSQTELICRLLLAAVLGSLIGFERERMSWAAGLRTHMLVSVGSALIMIVSSFGFADILDNPHVILDPSRVAAQVVSGIGFLGAGSILLRGEVIRGLTTAASLWSVAAVGLAIGGGLYVAAISATVIILFILAGLKPLEKWYFESRQRHKLHLIVDEGSMTIHALELALGLGSSRIKKFVVRQGENEPDTDEVLISFARISAREFSSVRLQIERIKGVRRIEDNTAHD
ncbi:MgtC/SapB family protein [Aquirhabdus sp.]|uniref:MgtC/SapB family protein n=1 Tax=Aquirhabdus sp. TaxID=2824160 RepID=UPI00396CD41B